MMFHGHSLFPHPFSQDFLASAIVLLLICHLSLFSYCKYTVSLWVLEEILGPKSLLVLPTVVLILVQMVRTVP